MVFTWWFIVVGAVFLLMALSSSLLARLPRPPCSISALAS